MFHFLHELFAKSTHKCIAVNKKLFFWKQIHMFSFFFISRNCIKAEVKCNL